MRLFRLLWTIHKWIGIALGVVLVVSSVTGYLLLVKKEHDWLQPPTATSTRTAAPAEQLRPLHEVYAAVFALGYPEFRSEDDIDRIDFRPRRRVHKIRSKHDYREVQVDAVTLEVLSGNEFRTSDLIEAIHDGRYFHAAVHAWFLPIAAWCFVVLSLSGYFIWLWPKWRRRRYPPPDFRPPPAASA